MLTAHWCTRLGTYNLTCSIQCRVDNFLNHESSHIHLGEPVNSTQWSQVYRRRGRWGLAIVSESTKPYHMHNSLYLCHVATNYIIWIYLSSFIPSLLITLLQVVMTVWVRFYIFTNPHWFDEKIIQITLYITLFHFQ